MLPQVVLGRAVVEPFGVTAAAGSRAVGPPASYSQNLDFGLPSPTRKCLLGVGLYRGTNVDPGVASLTIGGVAASQLVTRGRYTGNIWLRTEFWAADVPNGGPILSVQLAVSGSPSNVHHIPYRIVAGAPTPAGVTGINTGGATTQSMLTLDPPQGGAVIMLVAANNGAEQFAYAWQSPFVHAARDYDDYAGVGGFTAFTSHHYAYDPGIDPGGQTYGLVYTSGSVLQNTIGLTWGPAS